MKNKMQPTNHELVLRENDFIVSKTDLKGRITYANKIFVEFSGYTPEELHHSQHNIIRHPDMPRSVFKLLWDTIASGREFNGYVKNMSKDGSFYWVFANVTPSYDQNRNIIGYHSVRRKARSDAIATMASIYQEMLAAEAGVSANNAISASTELLLNKLQGVKYDQFVLSI